ncbi:hypothetical protein Tco_0536221 [Tanacetum coccineum]
MAAMVSRGFRAEGHAPISAYNEISSLHNRANKKRRADGVGEEEPETGNNTEGDLAHRLEDVFEIANRDLTFKNGIDGGTGNDKKKAGKRSVTKALVGARQKGVEGSGEHLKGICEAYKEYNEVENEGNEMFIFKGSGRTNSSNRSCLINMEKVKEIGELIGVSWTKAENQRGTGTNVETKKNGREERLKGV